MIHRPFFRALAQGGLLAALLLAAPAAGAGPLFDDEATSQRVADLYKRANALYDQKKLAEAEALYLEAWGLKHTYDVACNLGAIELDTGKPREAAEHFAFALREFPAGGKPAARDQVKARLALARAQVGTLRVRVNVTGAEVTVGDRGLGKAPVDEEVFVAPGVVTVSASAPGYESAVQSVPVAKGGVAEVSLTLRERRRDILPGALLGGGAGAALVTGAVLMAVSASQRSTTQRTSTSILSGHGSCVPGASNYDSGCPQLIDTAHSSDRLHDAGVGVLIGAGALAAGTAAYFLWPAPAKGRPSALRAAPMVSTTGTGLFISGSF